MQASQGGGGEEGASRRRPASEPPAAEPELRLSDSEELTTEMRSTLASMWHNNELCDVTVVAGSTRVSCHRVVLASASRYFRRLFASGMRDALLDELEIYDIDERIFAKALTFVYTGEVAVKQSEMTGFLQVASRLELSALLRRVISLFTEQLSPETAIVTYAIADALLIPQLALNAKALVCRRFAAVAAHSSFCEMPADLLKELIGSDALRAKEATVLEAVLRWVRS
ncbi:BTB/POZ protein, partial [Pavlovales sp. CCMP2436]